MLKPRIITPVGSEFLLTTGTTSAEAGVGIFVNCDGDVVRGTLEFSCYPEAIAIDQNDSDENAAPSAPDTPKYLLAAISSNPRQNGQAGVEIQRWDIAEQRKSWLVISANGKTTPSESQDRPHSIGVTATKSCRDLSFAEIGSTLRSKPYRLPQSSNSGSPKPLADDGNQQEDEFASRLGTTRSSLLMWQNGSIYSVVKNPLLLRLDLALERKLAQVRQAHVLRTQMGNRGKQTDKEIDLGWGIDPHDLDLWLRRLRQFLEKGHSVLVKIRKKSKRAGAMAGATEEEVEAGAEALVQRVMEVHSEVAGSSVMSQDGDLLKYMKLRFKGPTVEKTKTAEKSKKSQKKEEFEVITVKGKDGHEKKRRVRKKHDQGQETEGGPAEGGADDAS